MDKDKKNQPNKKKYQDEFWDSSKGRLKEWNKVRKSYFQKYHVNKIILLVVLTTAFLLTLYMYIGAKMTNVENLKSNLEQKTVIYDINNEVAGSLYSQKGTPVSLDHISDHVENAVISTEDQRFYAHPGFSIRGMGRAAIGYIINFGNIVGGGSTLTQQLAKNAYLSADQTLIRKLKELFLALEIEKQYQKDEILEMYLNNVYFGNGVWGVEDASMKYFGKSSSDLTEAEAATIAGMLTAPSQNNPLDNYEQSIQRRNTVLMLMADQGYISQDTMVNAQNSDMQLVDNYTDTDDYRYPYYFDAVIEEAINKYGMEEENIMNNGYQIYTNLNQAHQQQMNAAYTYDGYFPQAADGTPVESASVALNPQTGGVTAVIGGRGEHSFRGYNRATQMRRQPGSTMKPFGVYIPALEAGYDINDNLPDREISYGKENYTPYNVDRQFSPTGEVSMALAVAQSKNAPAVWLLNEIGMNKAVRTAEHFGITIHPEDENLAAVALGGMTHGVTPVEIASAYGAIANRGERMEPHFITGIVDSTGKTLVDNRKAKSDRATSRSVAKDMNAMLLNVFSEYGTAAAYQPAGYQVAGKTGTTDARFETGVTDKWLVGYSPDIVVAGWIGFDQPSELRSLTPDHNIGEVVQLELEGILPYTAGSTFNEDGSINDMQEDGGSSFSLDLPFDIHLDGMKDTLLRWGQTAWPILRDGTKFLGEQLYNFFYQLFSRYT